MGITSDGWEIGSFSDENEDEDGDHSPMDEGHE